MTYAVHLGQYIVQKATDFKLLHIRNTFTYKLAGFVSILFW